MGDSGRHGSATNRHFCKWPTWRGAPATARNTLDLSCGERPACQHYLQSHPGQHRNPAVLQVEQPVPVVIDVLVKVFQFFSLLASGLLDQLFQIEPNAFKTFLPKTGDQGFCRFAIGYSASGRMQQVKTIQDEFLLNLQALKTMPYPLVAITPANQQPGVFQTVWGRKAPHGLFLSAFDPFTGR